MSKILICLMSLIITNGAYAAAISVNGKLADSTGKVVDNASVKLLLSGLTATTRSDGSFTLSGMTSARTTGSMTTTGHPILFFVNNNRVSIRRLPPAAPAAVELHAANGRLIAVLFNGIAPSAGGPDLDLRQPVPISGGVLILRCAVQGRMTTVKLAGAEGAWVATGPSADEPVAGAAPFLGKRVAAFIDTIEITKSGARAGKWILTTPSMNLGTIRTMPKRVAHALILDIGKGIPMVFNRIEPGTFTMGSPPGESGRGSPLGADETQHPVTLTRPYYLAIYEMTQAQRRAVSTGMPPVDSASAGKAADYQSPGSCQYFCAQASINSGWKVRMPTEAEWEFAYRAGTQTAYFFGNDAGQLSRFAWFNLGDRKTQLVGKLAPNPNGLYDVAGNMWEWVADKFAPYPSTPQTDPLVPADAGDGVFRGGCTFNGAECQRAAARHPCPQSCADACMGFRPLVDTR